MTILRYLINTYLVLFLFTTSFASTIYKVRKGDSLSKIAKKFNTTTTEIILTNRLKPPYIIYPGQKLKIPTQHRYTYINYRVKKGDSLSKIAKKFKVSTHELARINRLKKPYRIYVGEKLKIPVKISKKDKVKQPSNKSKSYKSYIYYIYYRVRKGDSLNKIAKKFNISVKELIRINKLKKPYTIYVGQKLKVPTKAISKSISSDKATKENKISQESYTPKNSILRKVPVYKYYTVRRGDSLGKIARKFGVSVKSIIRTNRLKRPYIIRPGKLLKILVGYKDRLAINRPLKFRMPIDGRIDTTVREKGYKGIFIIAPPDEPVKAAEVGIVKFAGKDDKLLKKFGNTVILEHPQGYTTIYASLNSINVKPGQLVHRGEVIGTSGISGDWGRSGVYFEISKIHNGKAYPLNPLEVLR